MQVFIVKKDEKPYFVGLISDLKQTEYLNLLKECEERQKQEEQEKRVLLEKIANLEKKVRLLDGRIQYDEGKITQEDLLNGLY